MTLGTLSNTVVVIVTAEIEDHIRIISMRKADRDEAALYYENLG